MKKKIGISYTTTNFQYYWDWFTSGDLKEDVELVILSFEENNVEDIPTCDAFILTGGVDVHPAIYNGTETYPNQPDTFQHDRDAFERKIFEYSQIHRLPLLGICRGLQLVNVLQGGGLIQDLDEDNLIHRKDSSGDKQHAIHVAENTLLHDVVETHTGSINSAHHQAVRPEILGENLLVNAWADNDTIIEGLEFENKKDKAFMLCVQWHPERMADHEQHEFSKKIKQRFLQEVRGTANTKRSVINPATEEIITELNEDTPESLNARYEQLKKHQVVWQTFSLSERVIVLQRFSALLQKNLETLAAILTSEVGKPLQQSRNEINGACTRIKWLAENATKYLQDETMTDADGLKEKIVYEPLGVVCNISAWNYPYLVGVNVFVPALLAGNAVLYKPSEYALLTGLQIEKLVKEAGVPDHVFHKAIGAATVGEHLLELPFDGYFFTGSYKTGKYIYEKVAPKMVPCQCELGGKDPLYVADDICDVKAVAAATADGAFYNNGQSCCAVERIYVHEAIYETYLDAFVNEVKSYKLGDPTQASVYVGPLTRKEHLKFLAQQIEEAVAKGATVVTGGKRAQRQGYFFEPTVLVNVNHDMSLMKEESFGPVIGIMKVANDEEAIRLMQDTDYGLTASVYSSNEQRAMKILQQLNTGTGYWNCCDRVSAAVPWSGRKHSGFGSTLSHIGLRAFTNPKSYHLRK